MTSILKPNYKACVAWTAMLAAFALATPCALADGRTVVFSKTSGNISSVNYTTDATGTVAHLVADLDEGVYRVTQDGLHCGDFNCYDMTSTKPDGSQGDNTVAFTTNGGGTFEVTWIAELGADTPPAAPVITTDGGNGPGADYTTTESSLLLEGTCETGSETIEVNSSTSGVAYVAGQTTWAYTGTVSEGANVFEITATDSDTLTSPPATITITLDTTPPAAPVITTDGGNGPGADYTTTESSLLLEGTCETGIETIEVNSSTSGVAYVAGQTTWTYTGSLGQGTNVIEVTGTDVVGHTSPAAVITITLATASVPAPVITTDGGNGPGMDFASSSPALTLAGTCHTLTDSIWVNGSISGVTYTLGETSWSYAASLVEGPNGFSVTAKDSSGTETAPDSITITLDTIPPTVPVITTDGGNGTGADFSTSNPSVTIEGTCANDSAAIKVNGSTDAVSFVAGETSWSYAASLSDGANGFSVSAVDALGNASGADTITITLDTSTAPSAPVITTDGGNGPGVDYTTTESSFLLEGTCDSSTDTIRVNGSVAGVSYTSGATSWSYGDSISRILPAVATSFQNEGTLETDVLASVNAVDDVWSPADIVPVGTVVSDFYATGGSSGSFDALSLEFSPGAMDLTQLALRVYLQKGSCSIPSWQHYRLLAGTFNPEDEDSYEPASSDNYSPQDELPDDTIVGWVEIPFDATADPLFIEPNGNVGVTLRLWNWRIDAVELVQLAGGMTSLAEGANTFSVTAANALGNESAPDSITVTLDTTAPTVPIITTDGGNGPGADFTTSTATLTIEGTCSIESATIKVNGSTSAVTYVAGETGWSYAAALVAGGNTFSVTAEDAVGNGSGADTITITLDTTGPAAPVITTDGGNGAGADFTTRNASLNLAGTCSTESATIKVNGSADGVSYVAHATGWSYTASLVEGANSFSVTAADALGNGSGADTITITLDTTGPAAPVITTDGGNGPGADYLVNRPAITLEGTCEPSTVSILVNGSATGATYTSGQTAWTYTGTLVEGENTFAVTAADALDNRSSAATIVVTLDTSPPPSIRPQVQQP